MEIQKVYNLDLMGPPLLRRDHHAVRLGRKKALGLLAYLAFGKRQVSRDTLAALFWPDHDQRQARGSLRRLLSELRRELDEALIPTEEERVGPLNLELIHVDIEEFQALLARARAPGRKALPGSGGDSRKLLEQAAGLYRGEFLAGFSLGECGTFSDWQFLQAEYLRRELCAALARLAELSEQAGKCNEGIAFARRLVSEDPLNEEAHCALMRLYAAGGRREEALHQYRACAQVLDKELQLEPEEATTELYEAIRHSRPAPVSSEEATDGPSAIGGSVGRPRLAVLPFSSLAAGGAEWLSDGMTDALITELSKHEELEVISYISSRRYQDTRKSLRQVAAELGADHLLEGAVLKAGEDVRISVQLVDVASDRHVWAESFRGEFAGILELQEKISREVAAAVLGRLVPGKAEWAVPIVDPRAREACMLGDYTLRRSEREQDVEVARDYFRKAITLDQSCADAYAGLAFAHFTLGGYGLTRQPSPEVREKVNLLVSKALENDPRNARARMIRAGSMWEWDADAQAAESDFQKVLEIYPGHIETINWYAEMKILRLQLDEAFYLLSKASRLDPLNLITLVHWVIYYSHSFRFRRSLVFIDRIELLYPGRYRTSYDRARIYMFMGNYETAIRYAEEALSRGANPYVRCSLAYCYGKTGREAEALKIVAELIRDCRMGENISAYRIALAYYGAGRIEEALEWLERSLADGDIYLKNAPIMPYWGELHFDTRFQDIMKRKGVPLQLDHIRTALDKQRKA